MSPRMVAMLMLEAVTDVLDAKEPYTDADQERMNRTIDAQDRLMPNLTVRERNAMFLDRDGML